MQFKLYKDVLGERDLQASFFIGWNLSAFRCLYKNEAMQFWVGRISETAIMRKEAWEVVDVHRAYAGIEELVYSSRLDWNVHDLRIGKTGPLRGFRVLWSKDVKNKANEMNFHRLSYQVDENNSMRKINCWQNNTLRNFMRRRWTSIALSTARPHRERPVVLMR